MIPSTIRPARPRIVGPGAWPAHGPPPRFVVDTAGRPLFMVELAVAPVLMAGVGCRTADNYFYGGDGENAFAAIAAGTSAGTGRGWRVPAAVWARLGRSSVVYYRVVTLDQRSGRCDLSVDDHHLDLLPRVVVQNPHRTPLSNGDAMRTRGLDVTLPPHSVSPGAAAHSEPVRGFEPGDFLLSRAHGVKHDIIRWGQGLRLPDADRHYAGYTHAALVVSPTGELVEAIGEGVRTSSLRQYVIDKEVYQVVRIEASEEARRRVVEFAGQVRAAKAPYAGLAIVCTTVWAFTGSRLMFFMDGSYTCAGLVAEALKRMGASFGMNAARVTPAQLAVLFDAPPPPDDAPAVTRALSPRRWGR